MNRVGNQNPTFRHASQYVKSEGEFASQLSASYALTPHPWQTLILDDWLAVDDNGKLIHSFCVLEVPRQNGKTGVSDPRETWGLIKRGEQILHTAQEFQTAKKAFDRLRKKFGTKKNDPYAIYPELNALVDHYTVSAGQMVLDLVNGGHIEFRTRGNNSDMGRGGTFDLVVIDEAQAYTEEQDASLSPLNSAAPSGSPQTILMGTPPIRGKDKGIVFIRSIDNIRDDPKNGDCMHLWSVDEIGDISNKDRWYMTNPSLGYQLLEDAIAKDATKMSGDTFAREHLGYLPKQRELVNYAINKAEWEKCKTSALRPEGKTAYGIKFSADGSVVCLSGAVVTAEGRIHIELIECKSTSHGTRWLAEWLNDRYNQASCVVIDGKNGVDVLIDRISDTWKMKGSVIRPGVKDILASVSMLVDAVTENTLTWHENQDLLRESAVTSIKRPIAGGWGFGGDNSISVPIESCALAIFGAKTSKRDPSRKMLIG